jgi:2-dehydro-3-deoxy-D-arabinonate dehydratase
MTLALWRVGIDGRPRLARGDTAAGPAELLAAELSITDFLTDNGTLFAGLADLPTAGAVPAAAVVLAPVDQQPVWAAGVTFPRSRDARKEEARDGGDVYDRVYTAERPELFVKAAAGAVIGPGAALGIRADSAWNVPEPELAVVADPHGRIRALTLGNDMSSRSIEGENPLYLPQAKVYDRSCGLGPALVPVSAAPGWAEQRIELTIRRDGATLFAETVDLRTIRREPAELLRWLFAAHSFPAGVVLLTGTSMVPPAELTLHAGDTVTVAAPALGALHNPIQVVGRTT